MQIEIVSTHFALGVFMAKAVVTWKGIKSVGNALDTDSDAAEFRALREAVGKLTELGNAARDIVNGRG